MLIRQLGFAMKGATIDALAQPRELLALAWRRWAAQVPPPQLHHVLARPKSARSSPR
jgi:hypothetical protein